MPSREISGYRDGGHGACLGGNDSTFNAPSRVLDGRDEFCLKSLICQFPAVVETTGGAALW